MEEEGKKYRSKGRRMEDKVIEREKRKKER